MTTQHGSLEERFEEYIKKKFPPDQKHSTNGIIHAGFGEKIINCLRNPRLFSKEFRHYVKKNKFSVYGRTIHRDEGCFGSTTEDLNQTKRFAAIYGTRRLFTSFLASYIAC